MNDFVKQKCIEAFADILEKAGDDIYCLVMYNKKDKPDLMQFSQFSTFLPEDELRAMSKGVAGVLMKDPMCSLENVIGIVGHG